MTAQLYWGRGFSAGFLMDLSDWNERISRDFATIEEAIADFSNPKFRKLYVNSGEGLLLLVLRKLPTGRYKWCLEFLEAEEN